MRLKTCAVVVALSAVSWILYMLSKEYCDASSYSVCVLLSNALRAIAIAMTSGGGIGIVVLALLHLVQHAESRRNRVATTEV